MKVILVGSDKVFAIENLFYRHLKENYIDVTLFAAQSVFFDYYQSDIINKLVFRAGLSKIHERINSKFISLIDEMKPDLIWVFKGMELNPASLKYAKSKGIKLVNYNPDNPFLFSGRGSGNKNISDSIRLYDLHLTYHSGVKQRIEDEYGIPCELLPFGFDINEHDINLAWRQREILRPCFLGNPDKERAAFLIDLTNAGIEIDLYGNNWHKFIKGKNVNVFPPVYGCDYWMTLFKYRVQLNLMRLHNLETHNMRSFEIPGVGGIQLAPNTPDHVKWFAPESEIFLYKDINDCVRQIEKVLTLDLSSACNVRKQARMRSLNSDYSYQGRTKLVLAYVKQYFNLD